MSRSLFSPLEPERLDRSGRARVRSMRRDGGKTMAPIADRSVAHGTYHLRSSKPLQKSIGKHCKPKRWTDTGHWWADSHHSGYVLLGVATVAPLYTCDRHVDNDFVNLYLVAERLVQSGPGRCHSTHINGRKTSKSIAVRSLPYGTCNYHVI